MLAREEADGDFERVGELADGMADPMMAMWMLGRFSWQ
jgi:hypothetical protein